MASNNLEKEKVKKSIKLSTIIVNWNTSKLLQQCLESLGDWMGKEEVIVVDNGSVDDSVEMVKKKFSEVKVIKNDQNLGFAKANNQGIKTSSGQYILLLNSDTIVKEDALQILVTFLDENKIVGSCAPLLENENGSPQVDPVYLKFPSPLWALVYYNPLLRKCFNKLFYSKIDLEKPHIVDQLSGAAFMVRRDLLIKLGGLDDSFNFYFEDTDLSWRIKEQGLRLMVVPQAHIIHLGRQSLKQSLYKFVIRRVYLHNYFSLVHFCQKHYGFFVCILIKTAVLFNLLTLGLIQLLLGCLILNFGPKLRTKAIVKFQVISSLLFAKEEQLWQ